MKESTLRTPDEGELWSNGSSASYFAVINGKFVRVGMKAIREAPNALCLERDLNDFINPKSDRGYGCPSTDGVFNTGDWRLRADSYKDELERVVRDKLNSWSNQIRDAAKALAGVMVG